MKVPILLRLRQRTTWSNAKWGLAGCCLLVYLALGIGLIRYHQTQESHLALEEAQIARQSLNQLFRHTIETAQANLLAHNPDGIYQPSFKWIERFPHIAAVWGSFAEPGRVVPGYGQIAPTHASLIGQYRPEVSSLERWKDLHAFEMQTRTFESHTSYVLIQFPIRQMEHRGVEVVSMLLNPTAIEASTISHLGRHYAILDIVGRPIFRSQQVPTDAFSSRPVDSAENPKAVSQWRSRLTSSSAVATSLPLGIGNLTLTTFRPTSWQPVLGVLAWGTFVLGLVLAVIDNIVGGLARRQRQAHQKHQREIETISSWIDGSADSISTASSHEKLTPQVQHFIDQLTLRQQWPGLLSKSQGTPTQALVGVDESNRAKTLPGLVALIRCPVLNRSLSGFTLDQAQQSWEDWQNSMHQLALSTDGILMALQQDQAVFFWPTVDRAEKAPAEQVYSITSSIWIWVSGARAGIQTNLHYGQFRVFPSVFGYQLAGVDYYLTQLLPAIASLTITDSVLRLLPPGAFEIPPPRPFCPEGSIEPIMIAEINPEREDESKRAA